MKALGDWEENTSITQGNLDVRRRTSWDQVVTWYQLGLNFEWHWVQTRLADRDAEEPNWNNRTICQAALQEVRSSDERSYGKSRKMKAFTFEARRKSQRAHFNEYYKSSCAI